VVVSTSQNQVLAKFLIALSVLAILGTMSLPVVPKASAGSVPAIQAR